MCACDNTVHLRTFNWNCPGLNLGPVVFQTCAPLQSSGSFLLYMKLPSQTSTPFSLALFALSIVSGLSHHCLCENLELGLAETELETCVQGRCFDHQAVNK